MINKVSIIGSGAWATALANVLSDNSISSLLFSNNVNKVDEINNLHSNKSVMDFKLSTLISATNNMNDIISYSDVILLCVKSDSLLDYLKELKKYLNNKKIKFINCIKGFIGENNLTVSDAINSVFNKENIEYIVSLLGPSFATEVIKKDLTCVCAVSNKITAAIEVQKLFSNNYFRVYTSDDIVGSQIASSYKNAIAIGSGIIQGLNYGKNAEAAIVTRGLNEIIKFGLFNGGKINTFLGLTGIGDLLLTCSSKLSRNYCFGIEVAKSSDINALIKNNKKTIEGLRTIKVIHDFSKINNLDTPIIDALYNVLYLNKNINDEINSLMLRPLKSE